MSTKWVVTTAAERIVLDDAKQGGTTFTVTNPGRVADRVVFEPVPGTGAETSWFTVDEPQRRVLPAASGSFLLKVHVPADAKPGTYEVQGRVYSADSAPEESSVLSGRVVFEVAAPPAPVKRRIPWWIIAIAAALVVITIVVVTLVLTLGGGEQKDALPASSPSVTVAPSGPIPVPDLARLNETQAVFALKQAGLVAGTIKHRNDPAKAESVVEQSVPAATTVAAGTAVNLVVAVRLSPPVPKTLPNAQVKMADGKLEWTQPEAYVTRWVVAVSVTVCAQSPLAPYNCNSLPMVYARTEGKSFAPSLRPGQALGLGATVLTTNGGFAWSVQPVDDFGGVGPGSPMLPAQMVP